MNRSILAATCAGMLMIALPAAAQDAGTPTPETLSGAYTGKVYSPYARRSFPERPLWGDSHLHTSLSMDAGLFGNRRPPRDAYRFARGEEVVSSTGQAVRLSRPLDWLVVADHSDGMGLVGDIAAGKLELLAYEQAARWNKGLAEGGDAGVQAALDLITTFSQGKMDPEMFALYSPGSTRPMSPSATSGSRSTKRPRSRVTARHIRSCRPMTSSLITRHGLSATSTSPRQRPTTCLPANMPTRR